MCDTLGPGENIEPEAHSGRGPERHLQRPIERGGDRERALPSRTREDGRLRGHGGVRPRIRHVLFCGRKVGGRRIHRVGDNLPRCLGATGLTLVEHSVGLGPAFTGILGVLNRVLGSGHEHAALCLGADLHRGRPALRAPVEREPGCIRAVGRNVVAVLVRDDRLGGEVASRIVTRCVEEGAWRAVASDCVASARARNLRGSRYQHRDGRDLGTVNERPEEVGPSLAECRIDRVGVRGVHRHGFTRRDPVLPTPEPVGNRAQRNLLVGDRTESPRDLIDLRRLETSLRLRLCRRRRHKGGRNGGGAQDQHAGGGGTSRPSETSRMEGRFGFHFSRGH